MKQVTIELTDKEAQIVGLVSNLLLANCFEKEIKSTAVKTKIERFKRRTTLKLENSLSNYIDQFSKEKPQERLEDFIRNYILRRNEMVKPQQNDFKTI